MLIKNEGSIIIKNLVLRGELKEQFGEVVELYIELDERNTAIMEAMERDHGKDFLDVVFKEYMESDKVLDVAKNISIVDVEEFIYSLQNDMPYEEIDHINSLRAVIHFSK